MIDYSLLKQVAKQAGSKPADILALAPHNDPFYVGAKRQIEKAKWFKAIYEAMGSPVNCHIRRVHYWLVTTNAVPKPNGKPYENTQNDWYLLTMAAKYARYLGLVPIENIIDRRNPMPQIYANPDSHAKPSAVRDSIDEKSIIDSIVDQFYCFNPSQTQAYVCEIWAEKSTMNDVLEPICQRYGMNLVTGLGELSITAVYLLSKRIAQYKKPLRIFYVSDFDPAGECMPMSVARKIEYFVRNYDLGSNVDIKLIPLMLTSDQCVRYKLPRTPIKETEKRKEGFEGRHGVGATELDALEALYPGEMRRIISEAIEGYFDAELWNEAIARNEELRGKVLTYLTGGECPNCSGEGVKFTGETDLDGEEPIYEDCELCDGAGNVPGKIDNTLMDNLDLSDFDAYTPPIAEKIIDNSQDWLYNSSLEYLSQISRYKEYKAQSSDNIPDELSTDELDTGIFT